MSRVVLCALLAAASLQSQVATGTIVGVVQDGTGAVVPNAQLGVTPRPRSRLDEFQLLAIQEFPDQGESERTVPRRSVQPHQYADALPVERQQCGDEPRQSDVRKAGLLIGDRAAGAVWIEDQLLKGRLSVVGCRSNPLKVLTDNRQLTTDNRFFK